MNWDTARLAGWGRTSWATVHAGEPVDADEIAAAFAEPCRNGIVAFGNGRSYGDQALNDGGHVLVMRRLKQLIEFDASTGDLVCEAGAMLGDILDRMLPRRFMPPVSPGTGLITLGGAVANDVHGKNHEKSGSFCDHIRWLDLALPSGGVVRISRDSHPRWFAATVAGAGLTGTIVRLCVRMQRVPSNAVILKEERASNLDALIERLEAVRHASTFSVAWIDALASGARLGRGVLETAEFSDEDVDDRRRKAIEVPIDFPPFVLSPLSIACFNELYFRRIPRQGRERRLAIGRFLYPLDAIGRWNRMYGRRGFFQFQCVLPNEEARSGLRELLATASRHRATSFLAVLKTLGREGIGMLSFPMPGYTLALDFPNRPGTRALLTKLERITLNHGGRVYLAKDAALSKSAFRQMYPRLLDFESVLEELDPDRKLNSDMARRLLR